MTTDTSNSPMAYDDFVQYVAKYGFVTCPISREQYAEAIENGARDGCLYGMACDMNAGVGFVTAMKINIQRQ